MTWKIIKTKSEDSKFIQKSLQSEVDIFHQKCRNYGNNNNKDDDDDDDDDDITGSSLTYLWYTERSCSKYIINKSQTYKNKLSSETKIMQEEKEIT